MGNTDPQNKKSGKEYEANESAGNNRRASIACTANQSGKSSVRDIQVWPLKLTITARWYSDTTNQSVTIPMIALCLSGATPLPVGHNVALNRSNLNFYSLLPTVRAQIWFCLSTQALTTRTKLETANKSAGNNRRASIARTANQPGKSSVRDIQVLTLKLTITARWYSDTTNQSVTTPMIELCLSGATPLPADHNVALNRNGKKSLTQKLKRTEELSGQLRENLRTTQLLRDPPIRRATNPDWYQSKGLRKTISAPPIMLQTTAEIDGNLTEKDSNERSALIQKNSDANQLREQLKNRICSYIGSILKPSWLRTNQLGHLSGTCAWLQPVFQEPGASRLIAVDSSIRSTTRLEAPSSDCTRSPDEISTIGFSTSNWLERNSGDNRRRAAAAALGE
ncbi:hypothetical protein F511_13428 [Dorcoceras hygrometricum]|uniref:Uncharacterized protein n=1 Tax=Dorcoceras hygrometricum TaxID=472368 RepID=A0A2Z7A933_9LAMI|nr:hypothetical protein F511_13428 [Dorcoceras hygrometricum]